MATSESLKKLWIEQSPTYNINGGDLKKVENQIKNEELQ